METLHATPYLWTRENYERLADAGVFKPEDRVELLEGAIIARSPQNYPHSRSISRGNNLLVQLFGSTHYVRAQVPLNVSSTSAPEPDFALVAKELVDSVEAQPGYADLVIEVADSSLTFDRNIKSAVYAKAGLPEYWIVNLKEGVIEVHREPVDGDNGSFYRSRYVVLQGETIRPLFRPNVEVPAAGLF